MAWITPRTFVAAAVLTAAHLNETRDNLKALLPLDAVAWTSYTPAFTQSAVVTKTVTYAKYTQVGKWVRGVVVLTVTGAGTANNAVVVGVPVTAAFASLATVGTGRVFDTSASTHIPGLACLNTTTTLEMFDSTIAANVVLGQTGSTFSAALAAGDIVYVDFSYEAA